MPRVCLQFVIVVFPDYTRFFDSSWESSAGKYLTCNTKSLISRSYRYFNLFVLVTLNAPCGKQYAALQWRSQNAEKVTHIKGRLLEQTVILFNCVHFFQMGISLKGKNLPPVGANSFLEEQFLLV